MWKTAIILMFLMALSALAEHEALLDVVKRVRPNVDADAMLKYYQTNAPDLLDEIEKRRKAYPDAMDNYTGQLADHFQEIDKLRGEDNALYERKVSEERQQCQVRNLSREIQKLAKPVNDETDVAKDERLARLKAARLRLRKVLETAFDEAQKQQLSRINDLESEVRDLRRLAAERSANRDYILHQRFRTLTGEDWPAEK